jgi:hypothetical protein
MKSLCYTRRSGPWFRKTLLALMAEAGFETEFLVSASTSDTGSTVVFSDYYKHEDPIRRGVLMPLNENLFNVGLAQNTNQAYHFYISCRDDLVDEMRKTNIHPSCEIRPPWKLPPVAASTAFRPICLFFPSYGNWDEARCIAMQKLWRAQWVPKPWTWLP